MMEFYMHPSCWDDSVRNAHEKDHAMESGQVDASLDKVFPIRSKAFLIFSRELANTILR
jgi:hypothetical protein